MRRLVEVLVRTDDLGLAVVAETDNGRDALALVRTYEPEVVLLDLWMPVLDGLTALPELRRTAPDARIIVHSARYELRDEALRRGADAWLDKRGDVGALRSMLAADHTGDRQRSRG